MEEAVPAEAQGSTTGPSPAAALDRRLRPPTLRVSLLLGALLVAGTVLYLGRDALGPFILGLFLVYLLDPLVSVLHSRARLPRWLGVVVLYLAIVLGAVLIVRVTVPPLVEQISNLIKQRSSRRSRTSSSSRRMCAMSSSRRSRSSAPR
jgi:predicted PurR-regulated permease PerM